jgi:dolichol-phosphate mannosyltransferase
VDAGADGSPAGVTSSQPELSVVIPVYNEGPNIEEVLRHLDRALKVPHEVLVVYDHESDDTLPVLSRLSRDLPQARAVRNRGRGVLEAVRTGMATSTARYVLVTMADGSDQLDDLPRMLEAAERGAAVVCASRYMPGGQQQGGPRIKRFMSRLAGVSLHKIGGLPVHDPTSNFKLYARDFLDTVRIESTAGFELALELCVKAHRLGLPMAEVPTVWRDRAAGRSRFRLARWLPHYLRWYAYGIQTPFLKLVRRARRWTATA